MASLFDGIRMGMGQTETTRIWTAGFSPWFHLPGFHFGVSAVA